MKRLTIILLTLVLAMTMLATPAFAADGGSAAVSPVAGQPDGTVDVVLSLKDFGNANTIGVTFDYPEELTLVADESAWLVDGLCEITPESNSAVYTAVEDTADLNKDVLKLVFRLPEVQEKQTHTIHFTVVVKQDNTVLYRRTVAGMVEIHASEADHTYVWETTKEVTCEEAGEKTGTCLCGEVKQETVDAPGHNYGIWKTTKAATCTEDGEKSRSCKACGKTETETVAATGHSFGDWVAVGNKEIRTCTICGATEERAGQNPVNPFEDVKESDFFYEPVMWAVANGITAGYGNDYTFAPNMVCNRGQVVTFLWRAAGEPEPTSSNNPFTDIKSTDYFYKAVLWAVEKGITSGYGSATIFNPNGSCTRGQVATFLWRYFGEPAPSSSNNPFNDVAKGAFYYDAVLWAVEKGVTNGYGSTGGFAPDVECNRGQVVTFLYRAMN